jgi:hypothetical protein
MLGDPARLERLRQGALATGAELTVERMADAFHAGVRAVLGSGGRRETG